MRQAWEKKSMTLCSVCSSVREGLYPMSSWILLISGTRRGHVLETFLVCLLVGNENDLRLAPGHFFDLLREIQNGDLIGGADVENLSDRIRVNREIGESLDHFGNVGEAPGLLTITKTP